MDLAESLQQFGLSKNESIVYLTLLEHGAISVSTIAHAAKLHRPNVYDALDHLTKKGLVSEARDLREHVYVAANPSRLMDIFLEKEGTLRGVIPALQAIKPRGNDHHKVELFEGVQGNRICLDLLLENTKTLYVLGIPKESAIMAGEAWVKEWHNRRLKKKIFFHHILNDDYYPHRIKLLKSMPYTTLSLLPKKYSIPIATFVNEHCVVFILLRPVHCLIKINDEAAAQAFIKYYHFMIRFAKKA
jgi:predicted DNA-binding transcriptional regulator